jgi:hypothetical protein
VRKRELHLAHQLLREQRTCRHAGRLAPGLDGQVSGSSSGVKGRCGGVFGMINHRKIFSIDRTGGSFDAPDAAWIPVEDYGEHAG